jgi:hypothetical protein
VRGGGREGGREGGRGVMLEEKGSRGVKVALVIRFMQGGCMQWK